MRLSHNAAALRRITAAKDFGRVAVLLGGDSSEREISLLSGNAVLAGLKRGGVDAHAFDPREQPLAELLTQRFDRVWIALHGPGGEDGTLQGALEYLGVPYTGSGVMGSAIGMDKLRTKRLAHAIGVATSDYVVLRGPQDFDLAVERLGVPMIVKPATQGSSVGMSKVEDAAALPAAYAAAAKLETSVFAEPWITGKEYTVAVLQGRALPAIRIETPKTFYDYEAKYFRDDTRYYCPCGLSAPAEQHLASLAVAAFDAIAAEGWGRADFMTDATGRPLLLEVNTIPGMTDHSLVPMAARAAGIEFDALVWQVLENEFHPEQELMPVFRRPKQNCRKQSERRWRLPSFSWQVNWRRLAISGGSVAAVCLVAGLLTWTLDQPIESISVSGRFQRVAPVDVERVVKQRVRGAGLLSVNLDAVRGAIHTLPWVDAVSVQRAWPRGLHVIVIEQVAAARWGETGLLNTRGELFSNDERHIPPELAELSGPAGKESTVAQRYLGAQGRLIQAGLRLTAMRLDARGAWEFDLSNGVTVRLGRRQIDERFDKFINAAAKLVTQRGDDISYVDMRYTNGFAIGWRGGTTHSTKEDGGRDA